MRIRLSWLVLGLMVVVALGITAFFTRDEWQAWLTAGASAEKAGEKAGEKALAAAETKVLKLSRQARDNLGLVSEQVDPQPYWRAVQMPGMIVDRPGASDRVIAAPATGVVASVHAVPGDVVQPGDTLFTLRLLGESVHITQADLFKTAKEIPIVQKRLTNLRDLSTQGGVSYASLVEVETQLERLTIASQAYRQHLRTLGIPAEQIDGVAEGRFVSEIKVAAPRAGLSFLDFRFPNDDGNRKSKTESEKSPAPFLEVQELKVELGQQVQAGQTLCLLANHQSLYIEGHSFRQEAPFLEQAARHGWPVQVEFAEDDAKKKAGKQRDSDDQSWPPLQQTFTIRHLANTVDAVSRTFAFYLPLANQSRAYEKDGRTFLVWRFRPGQRVRLRVPVEEFKDVIVLPAAAVVREGPEAYVFCQNGDLFERRPVHVLHEDRLKIVLANDNSIRLKLDYVAQSAAASLNRVLKAQAASGGLPPGAHFHADGTLHIPGQ